MYSDSSFFNVFGFGGPKIKRIRIRRDIDISQDVPGKLKALKWTLSKVITKTSPTVVPATGQIYFARHGQKV